jgi:hypothetical protein
MGGGKHMTAERQNQTGGVIMSQKNPNNSIRCRVKSCEYHCNEKDYCSLNAIQVEPRSGGLDGSPAGESMCGSYHNK